MTLLLGGLVAIQVDETKPVATMSLSKYQLIGKQFALETIHIYALVCAQKVLIICTVHS